MCRLHAQLANLTPGGLPGTLSAKRARELLETIHPHDGVTAERKAQTVVLVDDVVRLDTEIRDVKRRMAAAVGATRTSLLDIYGAGPVVASIIIGHVVDVTRFASRHHFASYTGAAPIEASSGPKTRHRLNPRGNRQLNHALHLIAIAQIRHDTPGRAYYQRKLDEGKTRKEALRALKRRIADAVYRALVQRHRPMTPRTFNARRKDAGMARRQPRERRGSEDIRGWKGRERRSAQSALRARDRHGLVPMLPLNRPRE